MVWATLSFTLTMVEQGHTDKFKRWAGGKYFCKWSLFWNPYKMSRKGGEQRTVAPPPLYAYVVEHNINDTLIAV